MMIKYGVNQSTVSHVKRKARHESYITEDGTPTALYEQYWEELKESEEDA